MVVDNLASQPARDTHLILTGPALLCCRELLGDTKCRDMHSGAAVRPKQRLGRISKDMRTKLNNVRMAEAQKGRERLNKEELPGKIKKEADSLR